jgi:integrase
MDSGHNGETPGGKDLEAAVDSYVNSGSINSQAYRDNAQRTLRKWLGWLTDRGTASFEALNRDEGGPRLMRRYAQHLAQRERADGISAATARRYYAYVRAFLTWCVRDGLLDRNPAETERATSELPDDTDESDQQFWSPENRSALLSFLDERAREAVDDGDADPSTPVRDRALVALLAYSGVRGAEVFRARDDDRAGRQGVRWSHVDLDRGVLRVYGKTQRWEDARIPRQAKHPIEQHRRVQDPPSDEWPLFPTGHAPTLYSAARTGLAEQGFDEDAVEGILAGYDDVENVLREYEVTPPAITTEGARSLLKRRCDEADVDVDGEYLKPHGARRGIGATLYRQDRGEAQDHLRHQTQRVTREAYAHIDAEAGAEKASELIDNAEQD